MRRSSVERAWSGSASPELAVAAVREASATRGASEAGAESFILRTSEVENVNSWRIRMGRRTKVPRVAEPTSPEIYLRRPTGDLPAPARSLAVLTLCRAGGPSSACAGARAVRHPPFRSRRRGAGCAVSQLYVVRRYRLLHSRDGVPLGAGSDSTRVRGRDRQDVSWEQM